MAVVAPFRALRYDQDQIKDMRQVVTPPYDVINDAQQEQYYQSHPQNIIRVELNRVRSSDGLEDNRYTRSAAHLAEWRKKGILRRDMKPAFYLSETDYIDSEGQAKTRKGFFCALKVEEFSSGVVLPHEQTFTHHREDRFKLTQAVQANISPIFALFPDDENQVQAVLEELRPAEPLMDFVDPMGLAQRLYVVDAPQACQRVQQLMADKVIFIADGHHRYETALEYSKYMREKHPQAGEHASFNYVMTYLCSMSDPGLTVFPCHRLVPRLNFFDAGNFLKLAKPYFDCQEIPIAGDPQGAKERLTRELAQAGERGRAFGLAAAESDAFYVLTLKNGQVDLPSWRELPQPLRDLDVSALTNLALEHILGLDNLARDQVHTIRYLSTTEEVMAEVDSGSAAVGFLLNPTRVEQVKAVAEAGLIMPRKSTYFYPKVLTGLTINLLDPNEEAACLI